MIAVLMETPSTTALRIADAIAAQGYAVEPGFVSEAYTAALRTHALRLDAEGALHPAAVGRGAGRVVAEVTRGDRIHWLDDAPALPADWRAADGGALRLHLSDGGTRDVVPQGGALAAFRSECLEHEVLPAARPRLSLTGWFRRRE